jgi:hypothetical protein
VRSRDVTRGKERGGKWEKAAQFRRPAIAAVIRLCHCGGDPALIRARTGYVSPTSTVSPGYPDYPG